MIPYECAQCGNVIEVRGNSTNGSARTLRACEDCQTVTSHEKIETSSEGMSVVERQYLRQEYPEVYVTVKANTTNTFHVGDATGKYCYRNTTVRKVNVDKFPLGYAEWCDSCLQEIQNDSPTKA